MEQKQTPSSTTVAPPILHAANQPNKKAEDKQTEHDGSTGQRSTQELYRGLNVPTCRKAVRNNKAFGLIT